MGRCKNKQALRQVSLLFFILCDASIFVATYTTHPVCEPTRLRSLLLPYHFMLLKNDFGNTNDHEHSRHPLSKHNISKETIRSWSTKKLLRALDHQNIRYLPTASRSDLEDTFLRSNSVFIDYRQRGDDPYFQHNDGYAAEITASNLPMDESIPGEWKERLVKRAQRRQKQVGEKRRLPVSFSQNRVVQRIPRIAVTFFDGAVRRARRLKRLVADFWAFDDETGIRDVRYEYLRRETIPRPISPLEVVPVEHVNVMLSDACNSKEVGQSFHESSEGKPELSSSFDRSSRRQGKASAEIYGVSDDDFFPSRRPLNAERFIERRNDKIFLLPPRSVSNERYNSDDVSSYRRKKRRRRLSDTSQVPTEKRVYNPYGPNMESEKDFVDRVSEFLAETADRVMWGMFDEPSGLETPLESPDSSSHTGSYDNFSELKRSQRQGRPSQKPPRHWKDRMEERLDSMLGLHQDGDFYRSWTERFEQKKKAWNENDSSVSSHSQRRQRPRHPVYSKPFWEEKGSIISLLFGRSGIDIGRKFDDRPGFKTGSMLSVFRLALRSFVIVASYLCRWASTQGALPQPVVVFGVISAVLCARPHRRLMVAGIALLILRTIGELLHGYVHGTEGWENDDDFDSEDDSTEYENASDGSL